MEETGQKQLLKSITAFLEKHNISYMITGAWSVIYYARPRASHDIDFVVEIDEKEVERVVGVFEKLPHEFLVQKEQTKNAILEKSMFNILYLPTMMKLDFWVLKKNPFDASRFRRRKKVKLLDRFMSIATPEDTILKKLLWYQESKIEKHLIDAAFVYQIQKNNLDKKYLNSWAKKHKTTKLLNEIAKIDLENHY